MLTQSMKAMDPPPDGFSEEIMLQFAFERQGRISQANVRRVWEGGKSQSLLSKTEVFELETRTSGPEWRRAKEETEKVRGVMAPVTVPLMWKLRPRDVT